MPLMFLPYIMFAGFMQMLQAPAATPARIAAKATMRKPRHRDIDAD
jgi:hypothetical protein